MKDPKKPTKSHSKKSSVRLTSSVIPERYKIFLKPDLDNFIFEGEETIYLKLEKPTKEITLHASELEIESVEFIHQSAVIPAKAGIQKPHGSRVIARDDNQEKGIQGKISYNEEAETATFTFPKNIPTGQGELKLKFKGILNDRMRGFYRSQYEIDGVVKYMATTQFESTDARRAFPCFDEPSQKAIFDVTLMIPSHTIAISNTLETVVSEHASGYKIVEFAPTPKMSTYLLAFIVGEFEYIEAESTKRRGASKFKVRVFTTPGKKEQAKFALDVAVKCLDFYEQYFGIPYPLPVLDMIAIPDFSAGAMENWGAVTYRESALLVDEKHSSLGNKQWVALVVAHELAHQWFGNLVTMQWWTHLWLNEGFASFIEYLAVDHLFPEWDIWTQFIYLDQGVALELDGLTNTHPIEVAVHHPGEISEIFDKVSYSKGASVIRMLSNYLGAEDFRKGLSFYLKKHQYANASTEDLWEAFESVSGKPVKDMMKNWTSKPGYPVITISHKSQGTSDKLTLTQSRFFSSLISQQATKDQTLWKIPLTMLGQNSFTRTILMDKKSVLISSPEKGSWFKLNSGEVSFLRVDYPAKYLHLLKKVVEAKEISSKDRLGIVRDAFALSEAGKLATHEALHLAQSYKNEDDLTVWNEISSGIDKINNLIADEEFYGQYRNFGKEIYADIAAKMGWSKKKGEKHTDAMLRSLALYHLGTFGDVETIQKAKDLFNLYCHPELIDRVSPKASAVAQGSANNTRLVDSSFASLFQNDKRTIDPDLKGLVYTLVAEHGGASEHKCMMDLYKKESNQQEQERLSKALASFKDKKLLQTTLEFAFSRDVRLQSAVYFVVYLLTNPKSLDLTWEFIQKKWKFLQEKFAGGYLLSRTIQGLGDFTNAQKAQEIEEFFTKNPSTDVKRTVQQIIEQINSNADWLNRDGSKIGNFLKKYQKGEVSS